MRSNVLQGGAGTAAYASPIVGIAVTVQDVDSGDVCRFVLVPSGHADPDRDCISVESPVGEALYQSHAGDTVEIAVPDGQLRFHVLSNDQGGR